MHLHAQIFKKVLNLYLYHHLDQDTEHFKHSQRLPHIHSQSARLSRMVTVVATSDLSYCRIVLPVFEFYIDGIIGVLFCVF